MPDLTLPSPYPFASTTDVTAAGLNGVFYNDASPTSALNVMNGYLDRDNFASGLSITPELTQRGSIVDGWSVAGTANLDFNLLHFATNSESLTYVDKPRVALPIPGATRTFYLPRLSLVRMSWTVCWTNDGTSNASYSRIVLFVNGNDAESQIRAVNKTQNGSAPATAAGSITHYGYRKNRFWSGHEQRLLAAGWHSVGLRLLADRDARNTRIWARHLDIVAFTQ